MGAFVRARLRARVCVCISVRIHVLLEQRDRAIAVSQDQYKLVTQLTTERDEMSTERDKVAAESRQHEEQLAAARAEVSRFLCFPLSAVVNS